MDIIIRVDGVEYHYDNPIKAYTDIASRYNIPVKATQSILHYVTSHKYEHVVIEYSQANGRVFLTGLHVDGIHKYT